MRVLLATSQFAPELGGVPHLLSQFCGNRPPDVELRVLSVQQQPASFYAKHDAAFPLIIERVPISQMPGWTSLRMARRLLAAIRQWRPDIILCGVAYPTAVIAHAVTRVKPVPYVVYTHSEDATIPGVGKRRALGQALTGAAGLIAVSRFTCQQMGALGVAAERVTIIHPGIETARFAAPPDLPELAALRDRFTLLTVARWVRRKGFDVVLKAMPRILAQVPNAHYVLIGSGPDEGYFRGLIQELGLADHVTLAGRVSDEALPAYYGACDLFVMPTRPSDDGSEVEGFGIVYLEAAAAGKPAIGGRAGGVADAILDGETGLLVDPLDVEALAAAVIELAQNPSRRAQLGRNGLERVRREGTVTAFAAQVADVLRRAVGGMA